MSKKIIYVDMDDVLCEYSKGHKARLAKNPSIKFPQSIQGFFLGLKPIEDAIESIHRLNDCGLFDVYILTAPSIYNPLCYTEKRLWIEKHLGFDMIERLIISSNKGLSKGDYLIDDHIEGRGQENFEGTLLQFASTDFKNWGVVMSYFKRQYNA